MFSFFPVPINPSNIVNYFLFIYFFVYRLYIHIVAFTSYFNVLFDKMQQIVANFTLEAIMACSWVWPIRTSGVY